MAVALLWAAPAGAHVFQRSFADVHARGGAVNAIVDVDPDDFDETLHSRFDDDRSGLVDGRELERHARGIGGIVGAGMVVARGGERCRGEVRDARASVAAQMVRVQLYYTCRAAGLLRIEMPLFERWRPGHAHFLTVRQEGEGTGSVLTPDQPVWEEPPRATLWREAGRFFLLGLEHILVGYDHLLFLFALLLVSTQVRQLLTIVTAFTLAHSITLIGAALGAFRLPGVIVEPAIAATIVYVGVENFFVTDARRRWLLTFALGLVHGFGFAGLLADMGLPRTGTVLALVAFNLGVEVGQGAAVLVVVPALAVLRAADPRPGQRAAVLGAGALVALALALVSLPAAAVLAGATVGAVALTPRWSYRRVVLQGGSALVVLIGAGWFVSRVLAAW